jgi:GNAT superfamily N-acetyltransferase
MQNIKLLNYNDCITLAKTIGDTPETTIQYHLLMRGLCWAYIVGEPSKYNGVVIQSKLCPAEPIAFGTNAGIIWQILKDIKDWECIEVSDKCARELGYIITSETGKKVRYYEDIYHILQKPVNTFKNEFVRQITIHDLDLFESAQEDFRQSCFPSLKSLLTEGFVACAIIEGEIVGIAQTSARSEKYSDIGVFVAEGYRNQGFASASASTIANLVQKEGQIPVWSAGEGDLASIRVAQKLGFEEVSRMIYVIPEKTH